MASRSSREPTSTCWRGCAPANRTSSSARCAIPRRLADVVQEHLFDDPLAIIVRAGHPLARRRRVTAAALRKFQWIAPRAGSPLRVHFNALLASTGLELPSPPLECNSLAAARAFLLESDRIMLLSAHQIHYEMQAGLLVALPHPAGEVVRPIGLTLRRNWFPTTTQRRLLEILRRSARAAAASHAGCGAGKPGKPADRLVGDPSEACWLVPASRNSAARIRSPNQRGNSSAVSAWKLRCTSCRHHSTKCSQLLVNRR